MTPSDLHAIAAALDRMNAALDQCLRLAHRQHPPPTTRAGLIRRSDHDTHLNEDHG
jgi:hypothetical protein